MIENNRAATCEYAEPSRRITAFRFVLDAINGKVDSILSNVSKDNYGILEQIRDAYQVVNNNGKAFRNAVITPKYLDARLQELKWAIVAQELKKLQELEEKLKAAEDKNLRALSMHSRPSQATSTSSPTSVLLERTSTRSA